MLTESYFKGSNDVQLVDDTIGGMFDAIVKRFPNRPALIVRHQNIRWSYKQYQQKIDSLALGMHQLGIDKGDRVGIWSPNNYEWCLTQFATAKIGAIMVCINPAYRVTELEYVLNKSSCKAIVVAEKFKSSDYISMVQQLAPELEDATPTQLQLERLPHLQMCIRMGVEKTSGMLNFNDIVNLGVQSKRQLTDLSSDLHPDDAINIQFTSGTTGNPKGATLTHRNILNNGKIVGDNMLLTEQDKLCIPVPLYHCFGMVMGNLACITRGATAVFPNDSFEAEVTLQTVQDEQCTALHGVPTMFIAELELPNFADFNLRSLRTGIMAGSNCPIEVMKKVISQMHMDEVLIAYGQTETSPVNHMTSIDDSLEKRVTSVGRAGPHLEIKVIDENNNIVAPTVKGELCVRGYSVMQRYWEDEEQTNSTIDSENWLHSGDLAIMDENGYVEIVGRIKDMIIRGGENIYPKEIEEFFYTHPDIVEAQVFGIPDQYHGEAVCVWIKTTNSDLTVDDVRAFSNQKIAHYKVPKYIIFVEEYPVTVTGKIQKYKMREMTIEQLTANN